MTEDIRLKKLRWRCRRGMQELDTLLNSYLNNSYQGLDKDKQDTLERLLATEDDLLWVWLSGQAESQNTEFQAVIDDIRQQL